MTGATVTFYDVLALRGRIFSLDVYRRVINGAVIGLGAVAAACALVTTVTVAAAWFFHAALATNPNLHVNTPIVLINRYTTIASPTDFVWVSTRPADAMTFEVKWARAMASVPTRTGVVLLVPQHPVERANNVAALQPSPTRSFAEFYGGLRVRAPRHPDASTKAHPGTSEQRAAATATSSTARKGVFPVWQSRAAGPRIHAATAHL